MRRVACAALLALIVAPALAQERSGGRRGQLRPYADPADVLAAELAFARRAQDKGQWTAFRDTAAPDAQMFADGGAVRVALFLKGKPNPPVAVKWQPDAVWESCDGSYAVTHGAWQQSNSTGWFVTIWQRQARGGAYRWVLDQGDAVATPLPATDMIAAKIADCPPHAALADDARRRAPVPPPRPRDAPAPDYLVGHSDDNTLVWATVVSPDGARAFSLRLRQDGDMREVLHARAPAP